MNKFISFAFVALACIASVSCGKSYDNGYGNLANLALNSYGNSGSSSSSAASSAAAAPTNVYTAPAYGNGYDAAAPSYGGHGYHKQSYGPKYSVQPAYATELYPGQNHYQTYHSAPHYSQVALPVVPSSPVAKLYVPPQHSYGASSYGSPAASYGGY